MDAWQVTGINHWNVAVVLFAVCRYSVMTFIATGRPQTHNVKRFWKHRRGRLFSDEPPQFIIRLYGGWLHQHIMAPPVGFRYPRKAASKMT
jgi:hypothetical protein